jgi:hypothetical protein
MNKVYVLQESPGKNLIPATKYGQIIICLPPMLQMTFESDPIIDILLVKLAPFDSRKDYLLLMGDPAIISLASIIVANLTKNHFNLLKWDRQEQTYTHIEVKI